MPSPLIDALTTRHGFATVNESTVDAFLKANAECVLFFAGDPERLVESDDVAVILPELLKKFPQLHSGACREARRARLATPLPVQRLPCPRLPARAGLSRRHLPAAWLAGVFDRNCGHPRTGSLRAAALQVSRTLCAAEWPRAGPSGRRASMKKTSPLTGPGSQPRERGWRFRLHGTAEGHADLRHARDARAGRLGGLSACP